MAPLPLLRLYDYPSRPQALEIVDTFTRSGAVDVIVVDSVAALVPRAEIEGDMGDHHMALQARLMSQAMRKITASLSRSRALIIFLNQIRQKVGVVFGNPDTTPGGNALKFYASVRLEIRRAGQIKKGDAVTGNLTRVKVAKNKVAPPFRVAEFEMTYGHGICRAGEAADMAVAAGALRRAGAWYSVAHPELLDAVRAALAAPPPAQTTTRAGGAPADDAQTPPPAATAAAAASKRGGSKKDKLAAAAAAAAADAAAAAAGDAAAALASAAAAQAPATPPQAVTPPASAARELGLNEPFLQGRERVKAFFEEHPAALAAAIVLIKRLVKEDPSLRRDGGVPGTAKAAAEAATTEAAEAAAASTDGAAAPLA